MGVLAPLYLAGLAALSLPLIFHLVRRTPRGRQEFSSLMFLLPSPPRLTRRSRLDRGLEGLGEPERDAGGVAVLGRRRRRRLRLVPDEDELGVLPGQPNLDVAGGKPVGQLERRFRERVEQAQADRGLERDDERELSEVIDTTADRLGLLEDEVETLREEALDVVRDLLELGAIRFRGD